MKPALAYMMALADVLKRDKVYVPAIRTHPIEQKEEVEQLSKRKMQKMKGKKARKNRGQNRKPQDTAIYAMLRR